MGWDVLKWAFVAAGVALLALLLVRVTAGPGGELPAGAGRVPEVERTFEGPGADQVEPFDALLETANARIDALLAVSAREASWRSALGWAAVALTAVVTLLAALCRVRRRAAGAPRGQRTLLLVGIAVLAAVGTSVLVGSARLDKDAAGARQVAGKLYHDAGSAARAFREAKDHTAAEKAKHDLFTAIARATAARGE